MRIYRSPFFCFFAGFSSALKSLSIELEDVQFKQFLKKTLGEKSSNTVFLGMKNTTDNVRDMISKNVKQPHTVGVNSDIDLKAVFCAESFF